MSHLITTVNPPAYVKPVGPYSQAKIVDPNAKLVFLSGTIGFVPETNALISDDVVE